MNFIQLNHLLYQFSVDISHVLLMLDIVDESELSLYNQE